MNIHIVGCGGIGSFLVEFVDKLKRNRQFEEHSFTCYDNDIVETKNLSYQNFEPKEVEELKTEALSMRYLTLRFIPKRVDIDYLQSKAGLVVLCVDNNILRKDLHNNRHGERSFIDVRSNGRTVGIFTSDTKNYPETLSEDIKEHSCQYPYQIEKNEIEGGNIIAASIALQYILNFTRTGNLGPDFIYNF